MNKLSTGHGHPFCNNNRVETEKMEASFYRTLSWLVFLIGLLFLAPACRSTKPDTGSSPLPKRSPGYLLEQLKNNKVSYEWLSAKAKLVIESPEQNLSSIANIRMRRDSVIWMNIKKLSVEALRIQITPDSLYIIDRINRQYSVSDHGYLKKVLNLPTVAGVEIDFNFLQSLFLGNPIFFPLKSLDLKVVERQYQLNGTYDHFSNIYRIDGDTFLLRNMQFIDQRGGHSLQVSMDDYQPLSGRQKFSYIRNLKVTTPESEPFNILFKFSQVEIDTPTNIRFDIPARYEKVD